MRGIIRDYEGLGFSGYVSLPNEEDKALALYGAAGIVRCRRTGSRQITDWRKKWLTGAAVAVAFVRGDSLNPMARMFHPLVLTSMWANRLAVIPSHAPLLAVTRW